MIPRVTHKKCQPKPGKGKEQKTTIHHITWQYCVLCKKAWYSERIYKSQSSEQFNTFYSPNINKDLDGCLSNINAAVKTLYNTDNKMKKQMKSPNNQKNILFKLSNNIRTLQELNNIKNINKPSYDYSSGNISVILSGLESIKYSI